MWIMTPHGMLSAVKLKDTAKLQIRARDKKVLLWVQKTIGDQAGDIVATPERDYQYRLLMDPQPFALFMLQAILDIDYTNFKDATGVVDKDLAGMYGSIWWTIFNHYQPKRDRYYDDERWPETPARRPRRRAKAATKPSTAAINNNRGGRG